MLERGANNLPPRRRCFQGRILLPCIHAVPKLSYHRCVMNDPADSFYKRLVEALIGAVQLRVHVHSAKKFTFRQGSWMGALFGLLLLAGAGVWLGTRFHVELQPVEDRNRVRIRESTRIFGIPWHTKDYGEITVVKFVGTKGGHFLELRAPGRREHLRLCEMEEALMEIEREASRVMAKEIPTTRFLVFQLPWWVSTLLGAPALLLLFWLRPHRTRFDGDCRLIEILDWAGLSRRVLTPSQITRISVEDGDPSGWRERHHLPQRWLVVAHLQRGGEKLLFATSTDRYFAAQWAARAGFFVNTDSLPNVAAGVYRVWDRESPL